MAVMTVFHVSSKRLAGKCGLLLILAAGVGGCTTASIDDAVPTVSQASMPAPVQPGAAAAPAIETTAADAAVPLEKPVPPRSGAPVNTGAYPNINIVPVGVTNQLSDQESANLRNELYAEKDAQRMPGEPITAYIARLRKLQKLGSTHAAAALAQIEASQ